MAGEPLQPTPLALCLLGLPHVPKWVCRLRRPLPHLPSDRDGYGDSFLNTLIMACFRHGALTSDRCPRVPPPGSPTWKPAESCLLEDDDYALCTDLLSEAARKAETEIWYYCLVPNHVHPIAVPSDKDGLRETFADAHRRYTG